MPDEGYVGILDWLASEKFGRREDARLAMGRNLEQVPVAANENIRFAIKCQFQKFAVFRVAAGGR
jgi:hypothetical protein